MRMKGESLLGDTASLRCLTIEHLASISTQQRWRRRAVGGVCGAGRPLLRVMRAALTFAILLLFPAGAAYAAPVNDDITSATVVPELPFTDTIDTSDATTAPGDPDCAGNGHTVWYEFTSTSDANVFVEANTFGSDYDTTVSVYTGDVDALAQIACNDDVAGLQSRVAFEATAGTTYFIMVGSYGIAPGGNLVFTMDFAPPPLDIELTIDGQGSFDPASGTAVVSGTVTCSRPISSVDIFGELLERAGHLAIRGFFSTNVPCDGETPWSATAISDYAYFKGGQATVTATAQAFDPEAGEFDQDVEQARVVLSGR
ncbi:hypothetical protein ACMHYB_22290 [Sorangium sp. So ce1128]